MSDRLVTPAKPEVLQAPMIRAVFAADHWKLFGCLPEWCTP